MVIRKNKGKFCTVYGDDANIISMFFGYKILDGGKVVFPKSVLNKVINTLLDKKKYHLWLYMLIKTLKRKILRSWIVKLNIETWLYLNSII